jgi:hypothetical protein
MYFIYDKDAGLAGALYDPMSGLDREATTKFSLKKKKKHFLKKSRRTRGRSFKSDERFKQRSNSNIFFITKTPDPRALFTIRRAV